MNRFLKVILKHGVHYLESQLWATCTSCVLRGTTTFPEIGVTFFWIHFRVHLESKLKTFSYHFILFHSVFPFLVWRILEKEMRKCDWRKKNWEKCFIELTKLINHYWVINSQEIIFTFIGIIWASKLNLKKLINKTYFFGNKINYPSIRGV